MAQVDGPLELAKPCDVVAHARSLVGILVQRPDGSLEDEDLYAASLSKIPIRGVAVDGHGTVYAGAEQGQMLRFGATDKLEKTVPVPGVYWLGDVDLAGDGRLFFGGDRGELVITDRAFSAPVLVHLPTTHSVEIVVLPD